MVPEHAEINQLDIDTRSDIYSLGVLLYKLLTGSPPFSRKELEQGPHAGDAPRNPRAGAVKAEHEAEHGGGLCRRRPRTAAPSRQS
jgi:serine/threonine protein kinase